MNLNYNFYHQSKNNEEQKEDVGNLFEIQSAYLACSDPGTDPQNN